jgi:hypothetical protein
VPSLVAAMAIAFAVTIVATLASPLRQISGDTVPGRLGAAVLRCGGGFDLAAVDWIARAAAAGRLPYWAQRVGGRVISVFGPGPAVAGALAMPALATGDVVEDHALRRRERIAAAVLVGLAAALLALATAARRGLAASAGAGLVGAASFAGAATLGQGLWQQTVALPFLVGALAAIAWRQRAPRTAVVAPALLVAAVLLRPTMVPLAVGLGVAWCLERCSLRQWAAAAGLAVLAAAPLIAWNAVELGSVLPLGQIEANRRVTEHVFVLTRGQLGYGLGGLLLSPGRGWLWFAPIAVVGAVLAARRGSRVVRAVAAGVGAQVLVVAMFHMWWGGICFGPRFLAEATWVAIWLALGSAGGASRESAQRSRPSRGTRALLVAATAVTALVGQLGLWGWRAEQWETRRNPDIDQNALWDVVDSPVVAIVASDIAEQPLALDAPDEPTRLACHDGRLRAAVGAGGGAASAGGRR